MNNLTKLRKMANIGQFELAKMLRKYDSRIDVSMVSRFENGLCIPNQSVMDGLESIFGEPKEVIFSDITISASKDVDSIISDSTLTIINLIPDGKEHAISREELSIKSKMKDRDVRKEIENARSAGVVILNDQDGKGYYRSDELDALKRQYNRNQSRALAILRQQKYLKERIESYEC